MLSEKSKQIIANSRFREIYEMILQLPHNEYSYTKIVAMCNFMNATDARMDMSIIDEIFADYLCIINNNNNINGGVNYEQ